MTLMVLCKRCGKAFTPVRRDIVRGDWCICPGCRISGGGEPAGGDSVSTRPITPDAPERAAAAATAPQRGFRRPWWWRIWSRWRWQVGGQLV